ncbi:MAG: hypothetical protein KKD18_03860 [Nanoarchaeota archaeon]|nr:hypothetical protein [Nanoarchaeota archaeon]
MAKKKERFTGNKFKYTESELRDRGCGKFFEAQVTDRQWNLKKATYTNEGVWRAFSDLRASFRALLRDADGVSYTVLAHEAAQIMMDAFLIRRSRGVNVSIPKDVVPVNAAPDGEEIVSLIDTVDLKGKAKNVSENEKIQWIYENMQVAGLELKDAPTMGTWTFLQRCRTNERQMEYFYNTLWPKLMTKEEPEKGGRLYDNGAEVIDLIERLESALTE